MNVINPAYAGSKESILVLLYRKQWVNIEDAHLIYFSGHAPTGKMYLGFISDKIGPVTEQNVYGDLYF
jgi:hypothetical protein